ncbi:PREDICTED: vesicle-associated membrane protein-associated protein A-like isoform X2 [Priapulus caudatus]|uniref:Vesicle-associated membrane protein-associated protein A-like isoform X2 n=1 Tax=Priapulus caudatus TaxID=37621 RepID=A0ABM1EGB6_PRICU|nr:PREDICTED: vesicle-associated membrane protein-associated protein A-like isoform X2 [Priapulus caudatus]
MSGKQDQVIVLEPSTELRFKGPFTDVVTTNLKLINPTEKKVCFKVKTTAPKRYCVRPNSGIISPNADVLISVMLQPFEFDPNEKSKHKFMVQTVFAATDDPDLETVWRDASPDQLMDSKLKCVFIFPVDSAQNNLDVSSSPAPAPGVEEMKPNVAKLSEARASPKVNNVETDLRNAMAENKRLLSEIDALRKENKTWRDDDLRLRRAVQSSSGSEQVHTVPAGQTGTFSTLQQLTQGNAIPPIMYLVAALILGLIVGKFIL